MAMMDDIPLHADSIVDLLETRARTHPDKPFVRTAQGSISYAQARRRSAVLARQLQACGVREGSPVVVWMHNSIEQVLVWFALARLCALHIPINTALMGENLRHVLNVCAADTLVVDRALMDVLAALPSDAHPISKVVVHAGPQDELQDCPLCIVLRMSSIRCLSDLMQGEEEAPVAPGNPLDTATLLFTSGTTGASKACMLSRRYLARQGGLHAAQFGFRADDVLYSPFPLFHVDAATLTVVAALTIGCTAALGLRFSASRFWEEVRQFDASVFNFMGATLTILYKREPTPQDRQHRVRLAWGVPMPEWKSEWEARFGFALYSIYGLTDGGIVVYDPTDGSQRTGACGRVIAPYEVRILPLGHDASPGMPEHVGEILIRSSEPGLMMTGYYNMPQETARTIDTQGWLHTGDLGSLDADGFLTFHGRLSDSIRRRGENISAYEVEQAVDSHPCVLESAAVGVPSELTEEDVKVFVVRKPGMQCSARELYDHCRRVAPAFMAPRYIEWIDQLPKTPTQKVEKFKLKARGHTMMTFDAQSTSA